MELFKTLVNSLLSQPRKAILHKKRGQVFLRKKKTAFFFSFKMRYDEHRVLGKVFYKKEGIVWKREPLLH